MGEFRNIFKELRKAAGLSQAEMAKKLGISRSTAGMYETGQREPDFETLEVIADFFNVDVDYLIGRTNKTTVLPNSVGGYYLNEETAQMAQELFENKEMRILFSAARDAKPEDLKTAADVLLALKRKEVYNGDDPA